MDRVNKNKGTARGRKRAGCKKEETPSAGEGVSWKR
jgi:hypothetical protein